MLRYNTEDIVKKALSLADLQNSDFITYEENISLLNDAYMKLYQNAINVGDELYIKSLVLSSPIDTDERKRVYSLPSDFYQLYSVKCSVLGKDKRPLFRKVKDGSMFDSSYELRNDTIIIYGELLNEVEIEYYPVPATLFLEREPIKLENSEYTPVGYYKDIVVSFNKNNNTFRALDIIHNNTVGNWNISLEPGAKISDIKVDVAYNGFSVTFKKDDQIQLGFTEWDSNTLEVFAPLANEIAIRQGDGIFINKAPTSNVTSMLISDENEVYTIKLIPDREGTPFEYLNDTILLSGLGNRINLLEDDKLFISNNKGELYIFDTRTLELKTVSDPLEHIICAGDYSIASGYGLLIKKMGRGYFIKSPFKNTKLDYSNNIYFTLVSYMLAISYKIKQNADITGLNVSYNEALNQYFNMFKRDANAPLRMNNIYR